MSVYRLSPGRALKGRRAEHLQHPAQRDPSFAQGET